MMANVRYILSLDQGTTSSRAVLIDINGSISAVAQREFRQIYPQPGWVEHDPNEIWETQLQVAKEAIAGIDGDAESIAGIGITNQRETTILWDRDTGVPLTNAIVWQDRRTADFCDNLKEAGWSDKIQLKTGLLPDAYFSATKVKWILDNISDARKKAEKGKLAFGTVDTWLIWNLTGGKLHLTDVTNASRTMFFNINSLQWDPELLQLFDIPAAILPEVKNSSEIYGDTVAGLFGSAIPIGGIAGDQQAALFGQMCFETGMVKNTLGTGCFIMMNTGEKPIFSKNNLLTTIGWSIGKATTYALEGSIFMGGAVVQWLRDGLKIINDADKIESLAKKVEDNGGIYLVPAFTGLGAPHWDPHARGTIIGITRGTTDGHIARAALESIAFQTKDVLDAMLADASIPAKELRVDGGAAANNLLMQFQADITNVPVIRPKHLETTAMGAGFLAGLSTGFWSDIADINALWQKDVAFSPVKNPTSVDEMLERWQRAVGRSKEWAK